MDRPLVVNKLPKGPGIALHEVFETSDEKQEGIAVRKLLPFMK